MDDVFWAVWFDGSEDEPEPGVCVHDNQLLIFTVGEAEAQARAALIQLTSGEFGWMPSDPSLYRAVPVEVTVREIKPG